MSDPQGYELDSLSEIERGARVTRAEQDENELHPVAREAVVNVRGNAADRSRR